MPSKFEQDYCNLIEKIIFSGQRRETRNHPTYSIFGEKLEINSLEHGHLPLITGRKMYPKGILGEFAAMLRGVTNVADFEKFGCNYWGQWADEDGALRVDYGNTWRDFEGFDQLANVIETLKKDPSDRRMLISGWRPHKLAELSLPCCHMLYQWYVEPDTGYLQMLWYQRSVDTLVGLPSDILLAAIWNILLAKEVGRPPGKITMMLGDTHIYASHWNDAMNYVKQAKHAPLSPKYRIADEANLDNFEPQHLTVFDYNPEAPIKFDVHA